MMLSRHFDASDSTLMSIIQCLFQIFPAGGALRRCARLCGRFAVGVGMLLTGTSALYGGEINVRLLYIGDINASAYRGAQQGLHEAQIQGGFMGQNYTLVPLESPAGAVGEEATAIVAALPAMRMLYLAKQHPDIPVLNLTAREDELRELCENNLLDVIPSRAMLADAVRQWQRKQPGSQAIAQAWHHDFEKYAAAQLNRRYQERFHQAMDDDAWAGWAAVKLLSDMVAREQTADGALLLDALKSRLAFDGQKGMDMSFRETGQLRQPLLLVEAGRVVGEAPVRGIVGATNLDSLGLSHCSK